MTAVVVFAAGLVFGGVAVAAPQEETAPAAVPVQRVAPKSPLRAVPPRSLELGPEHKILGGFVGHWKTTVHIVQADPSTPVPDGEGTADGKVVMGGRFAQVTHAGTMNGQPFEGMMLCGFDEVVKKYTSSWVDNASTAIIHYVGTYDASKKQLTMSSHYSEQTTRRLTLARTVMTFVDANTIVYDEYIAHAVGEKETHTMSVTYKRA
jgi:hypothetical protein